MHIFVFNSRVYPDVLGLTHDITGGNLPPDYAPWEPAEAGGAVLVGGDVGPVADAIRRDGFFIAIEGSATESTNLH